MNRRWPHLNEKPHRVYVCRNAAGEVIYVGCTYDLRKRTSEHRSTDAWWSEVAEISSVHYPDRQSALIAEAAVIYVIRPFWNSQVARDDYAAHRAECMERIAALQVPA